MRVVRRLLALPRDLVLFARAMAADPVEAALYIPEQFSWWLHRPVPYEVEEDWGPPVHKILGATWPCPELLSAQALWAEICDCLRSQGLDVGRGSYAGVYSDADPALAAATWCSVRHLQATKVVETGVARGVTTRMVLEAIGDDDNGHLWSVDLPYLFSTNVHDQTAVAVPARLRQRWTYVRGSSRRRLKPLLAKVGPIDLFVHDSLHTVRNMRFEMEAAWAALRPGGVMLIDDVDKSAFRDFSHKHVECERVVCRSGDGPWLFGVVRKPPGALPDL